MFFPWIGMLEQIRLADVYVHYSDVAFSKGSFVNRVQVKTANDAVWMTVPLRGLRLGQRICDVPVNDDRDWRRKHRELLRQAYAQAPFRDDMLAIVDDVYGQRHATLDKLSTASTMALCEYFDLAAGRRFVDIRELDLPGEGSGRVLDIVLALGGNRYITGLGAKNYLDHESFDQAGIRVDYMNYQKTPYPQQHGEFTPYVSALDLVANAGKDGIRYIDSGTISWKEYLQNE